MARRRADGGSFAFDLEPDDDDVTFEVVAPEPSRLERAVGALGSRVRSWPRRRVVAGATVGGVLAVGGVSAAVLTAQAWQWAWEETAATAPGAVLDLRREPVEAWRVNLSRPFPVALVDGTLVVQERRQVDGDGPTPVDVDVEIEVEVDGRQTAFPDMTWIAEGRPQEIDTHELTLHGIDLVTGDVVWSSIVPGAAECTVGALSWWTVAQPRVDRGEAVVCLSDDQRAVTVVDGQGEIVASRELADSAWADSSLARGEEIVEGPAAHRVVVTPSGDLIRIDRLGVPSAPPAIGPLEGDLTSSTPRTTTLGERFVNRDVRVRLEDAATGDVRWETVLDAEDYPAGALLDESSRCLSWQGGIDTVTFEPDALWYDDMRMHRLWISMCGLDVVVNLETGEAIAQDEATGSWQLPLVPLADGGWAEIELGRLVSADGVPEITSHVMRADGSPVGDVPGLVQQPLATDGPQSALLVTANPWLDETASAIAAYDADDAALLWTWSGPDERLTASPRLLAVTADVVVVSDGTIVTGLDRETGEMVWEHWVYEHFSSTSRYWSVTGDGILGTWTDGRHVAVVSPANPTSYVDPTSGEKLTTTLDLATGEIVWTATSRDPLPYPIAGRLYRFDIDALVALK